MEVILKQRLIGAAVIIALAVVLIPMLLDSAGTHLRPTVPDEPRYLGTHVPDQIRSVHTTAPVISEQKNPQISVDDIAFSGVHHKATEPPQLNDGSDSRKATNKGKNGANTTAAVKSGKQAVTSLEPESDKATPIFKSAHTNKDGVKPGIKTADGTQTDNDTESNEIIDVASRASIKAVTDKLEWTVQIASFKSRTNADLLSTKLSKAGFRAYVKQSGDAAIPVYRVRVGREVDQTKAKEVLSRVKREIRLNGYVTKF